MGYVFGLLVGILLGLIGAGGSILTVPVLVYVVGISAVTATSYSLVIVGVSSLVGAYEYWKRGLLHLKTAMLFVLPSIVTILLVRIWILPILPNIVFEIGSIVFYKDEFFLWLMVETF